MTVCVIGGGVVGLACAYELASRGAAVCVLERGRVGEGASKGNTGWITASFSYPLAAPGVIRSGMRSALSADGALVIRPSLDPAFLRWLWRFRARSTVSAFREATQALMRLNAHTYETLDRWLESGVAFEQHVAGLVLVAHRRAALAGYLEMFDVLRSLGLDGISGLLPPERCVELEPAVDPSAIEAGVHASNDRFVQPQSLTAGLAAALPDGAVREGVDVRGLERRGAGWRVLLSGDVIEASAVVVATGVGTRAVLGERRLDVPIQPAKGYSVTAVGTGTRPSTALYLAEAKVGLSGYRDAVRVAGVFELPGGDGVADRGRIEGMLRQTTAYLRDWEPGPLGDEMLWAGSRPVTPDGLPIVGEVPGEPGLFLATGHGMLGVTLAPATAALLAPVVLGERPADELAPFAPRLA